MLERLFDEHSDGRFVKTLLVTMLLLATVVQPFSLIYTAFGENLPDHWWAWTPALAAALFVALDWTILPLAYFFATTNKPGLKIVLALMLAVVAFGAFDGYFVASERFVALRLKEITMLNLKKAAAEKEVAHRVKERDELKAQQERDRVELGKKRDTLNSQLKAIDDQVKQLMADKAADLKQHDDLLKTIRENGRITSYRDDYINRKSNEENKRHETAQAEFIAQLKEQQAKKADLLGKLNDLPDPTEAKVDATNEKVAAARKEVSKLETEFTVEVMTSQVYRWAGVIYNKEAGDVTANEANRILDAFAAAIALGYIVAQVMLAISFYGRHRQGFVEATGGNKTVIRAIRAYFARKRRPVYRTQTKEVYVPVSERTRIVYVPVNPGGPVPPAEEFVTAPATKVANEDKAVNEMKVAG
jgi:hypothetical protein